MEHDWKSIIGQRLKHARDLRKLTQQRLADKTDYLSPTRISNYEQGIREPDREEIAILAQALEVPALWLGAYDLLMPPDERALYHKYWGTDDRGRWQIHNIADAQPATDAGDWNPDVNQSA